MAAENDPDNTTGHRLSHVSGYEDRVNDVYILGNVKEAKQHVIFFGGDTQDFRENMLNHRDNQRYADRCVEDTAQKLLVRFPNSLVIVIMPSYMYLMTFAVYRNFWTASQTHNPLHSENNNALEHLFQLYRSAISKLCEETSLQEGIPINLIGFSKGCTVLNQFVYELHLLESVQHLKKFVSCFKALYWLDGGHCGGPPNTWVTQDFDLKHLASLQCDIFIHVSPYQIKDPLRDWVRKEESKFHKKLKEFNAKVYHTIHFESLPRSVDNHFGVLDDF